MRMSTKMVVGYLFLIVLPFLIFSAFVYNQLYGRLVSQYQLTNQQNMEQQGTNLEARLSKIESLYSIYQNNSALLDFLRGDYVYDRDLIFSYLKEISPAFAFASLGEPMVEQLVVYPKIQDRLLSLKEFADYSELEGRLSAEEKAELLPARGLWKKTTNTDSEPSLVYYHKLYSETYTSELGIVEITVKSTIIDELMKALSVIHPKNTVILLNEEGTVFSSMRETQISSDLLRKIEVAVLNKQEDTFLVDDEKLMVNSAVVPRLGLTIIEINKQDTLFQFVKTKLWLAAVGIVLLGVLSLFYYLLLSSLTKRILLLSRHMRKVGLDDMGTPYSGKIGKDEIGFLLLNYNAMIRRIDELVNRVQKVELLKKDADFKMLQAQIQPHFLYNTLETMRMLARSNKDYKVADMAYSLGNLLRYSLTQTNDTTLQEELEHVKAYIAIHQIRIRELHFDLEVEEALLSLRCPRFILQPLLENSMIHGLANLRGQKRIAIRFKRVQESIEIQVMDNGEGIPEPKLSNLRMKLSGGSLNDIRFSTGTGIGLGNVVERVKAYYGHSSTMLVESGAGQGTTFTLILRKEEEIHHVEADDRG
ncbi:sensor histidine kinase [Paenibacillus sp. HB172176]|uniref:sensor histidine kinase n=1 Tax=Paenibacillus sp. HB172176 TaxID=2493690 RepID=UPI00143C6B25|nr:sensor histidine kinase [Paenibacillus sp. HB172176]